MDWYGLADKLGILKELVFRGYLDYKAATEAVNKLVKDYLEKKI